MEGNSALMMTVSDCEALLCVKCPTKPTTYIISFSLLNNLWCIILIVKKRIQAQRG